MLFVPIVVTFCSFGLIISVVRIVREQQRNHLLNQSTNEVTNSSEVQLLASNPHNSPHNITIIINEMRYKFVFDPSNSSIHGLAIEFCSKKGNLFGFEMSSFSLCVTPLIEALIESLEKNTILKLQYDPAAPSDPNTVTRNADPLHSEDSSNATKSSGPASVPQSVPLPQETSTRSGFESFQADLYGTVYEFAFNRDEDIGEWSVHLAGQLCQLHGIKLLKRLFKPEQLIKIRTKDALKELLNEGCRDPVADRLAVQMNRLVRGDDPSAS